MVTHSSIIAWRIPWTEEPGRLQSTGSQRVGHVWATNTILYTHFQIIYFRKNYRKPCFITDNGKNMVMGKRSTDNGRRDVINVLRYLKYSYMEDRSFSKFKTMSKR